MTDFLVPTSLQPWGTTPSGGHTPPTIPMPGSPDYVPGTDISAPLFWWLSTGIGIGTDGYSLAAGTDFAHMNRVLFQPGQTYWVESGVQIGNHAAITNVATGYIGPGTYPGSDGFAWTFPAVPAFAYRYTIFDLQGARLYNQDGTNYSDGLNNKTGIATFNSQTVVLDVALTVGQVQRFTDAGLGGTTIQSAITGTGKLFNGGVRGVNITAIAADRKTLTVESPALRDSAQTNRTVSNGVCNGTNTQTSATAAFTSADVNGLIFIDRVQDTIVSVVNSTTITTTNTHPAKIVKGSTVPSTFIILRPGNHDEALVVYLPAIHSDRINGLQLVQFEAPGSFNGQERQCMALNNVLRNGILQGSNPTHDSGILGLREEWMAIRPSNVDGLVIEDLHVCDIWSDFLTLNPSPQAGMTNAGTQAENILVQRCTGFGIGRHFVTNQGSYNLHVDRCVVKDITRLLMDSEVTSLSARIAKTTIENSAFFPGTVAFHIAGGAPNLTGEPPHQINIQTYQGQPFATVDSDVVTTDDQLAFITGAPYPAGTYVARRLNPTFLEMSAAATADSTGTAMLHGAVMYRDITFRKVGVSGGEQHTLNIRVPRGRVYFTADVTQGSPVMSNIVFDPRDDGQVFTLNDILPTTIIHWLQNNLFNGGSGQYLSKNVGANTITMPSNATQSSFADRNLTLMGVADTRTLSRTTTITVFNNLIDKGHAISGPGVRPHTIVDSAGPANLTLSEPLQAGGTNQYTENGKARFWVSLAYEEWTGYTIDQYRDLSGFFSGDSAGWDGKHGIPDLLMAGRMDNVSITRCMLAANLASGVVARYMVGAFDPDDPNNFVNGIPTGLDSFVVANNLGYQFVDNQMAAPTVTTSLTLTVDDTTSTDPTFTATVTFSDGRIADGETVCFYRNGNLSAMGILDSTNTCHVRAGRFTTLATGFHTYTAVWGRADIGWGSFDTLYNVSPPVTLIIGGATAQATTTALASSIASPSVQGTSMTLTATVTPDPSSGPIGTVTFKDGATTIGTANVGAGGTAALTLPTGLSVGSHSLTAVYGGTVAYLTSTSTPAVPFTVNPASSALPTTTTLSSTTPNPAPFGTDLVLNAAVSPNPSGGTVAFKDGSTTLGTVNVDSSGNASLTVPGGLSIATHSLTAVFSGTPAFLTSTSSPALSFVYGAAPAPPTVTATVPFNGQTGVPLNAATVAVIFSEALSAPPDMSVLQVGTPAQTVPTTITQGADATTWVMTLAPVSGSLDPDADYAIVVADAVDTDTPPNHLASSFLSAFHTAPAATGLTITASLNPGNPNPAAAPILRATLTQDDGSTPPGSVEFRLNGLLIGTVALTGSSPNFAQLQPAPMAPGSYTVTAHYSGQTGGPEGRIWTQQSGGSGLLSNAMIDRMVTEGANGIRISIDMSGVYGSLAAYTNDTPSYGSDGGHIQHAHNAGMKVLANPAYSPGFMAAQYHQCPRTDAEIAQWAEMCRRAVRDLGQYVDAWEIWNEANHGPFNLDPHVADYRKLLRACVLAMRSEDPNVYIMNSGPASDTSRASEWTSKWDTGKAAVAEVSPVDTTMSISQATYLDGLFHPTLGIVPGRTPGTAYLDAYAIHAYTQSASSPSSLIFENCFSHSGMYGMHIGDPAIFPNGFTFWNDIVCAREGYADPNNPPSDFKPIWITEAGLPSRGVHGSQTWTESRQASEMAQTWSLWLAYPFSGPYCYFHDTDADNSTSTEGAAGLHRNDGTAKPVLAWFTQFATSGTTTTIPPVDSAPYTLVIQSAAVTRYYGGLTTPG